MSSDYSNLVFLSDQGGCPDTIKFYLDSENTHRVKVGTKPPWIHKGNGSILYVMLTEIFSLGFIFKLLNKVKKVTKFGSAIGRHLCLSIWGFGWKPTVLIGILKTQSRQTLGTHIWYMTFSTLKFQLNLWISGQEALKQFILIEEVGIQNLFTMNFVLGNSGWGIHHICFNKSVSSMKQ